MDKVECLQCQRLILPATAEDTDGLCMPCFQGKTGQLRPDAQQSTTELDDEGYNTWDDIFYIGKVIFFILLFTPFIWMPLLSNIIDSVEESRNKSHFSLAVKQARQLLNWDIEPTFDFTGKGGMSVSRIVDRNGMFFDGKLYICTEDGKPISVSPYAEVQLHNKRYNAEGLSDTGTVVFVRRAKKDAGQYKYVYEDGGGDTGIKTAGARYRFDMMIIERETGRRMRVILDPPMISRARTNASELERQAGELFSALIKQPIQHSEPTQWIILPESGG